MKKNSSQKEIINNNNLEKKNIIDVREICKEFSTKTAQIRNCSGIVIRND